MEVAKIEKNFRVPISKIDLRPYDIDNIILYKMLKKDLSILDKMILSHTLFSEIKLTKQEAASFFKLSVQEYENRLRKINVKVRKCLEDKENFAREKKIAIHMYGTKIFMLVPEDEVKLTFATDDITQKILIEKELNAGLISEIENRREEAEIEVEEEIKEEKRLEEVKKINEHEKEKD